MKPLTKILLVGVAVLAALLAFTYWRYRAAVRAGLEVQIAPAKADAQRAQARVETVTVRLAAAERVVTRTVNSVRIDTLLVHPESAADTARALVQLPALAAAHDSLQRSCAAYVVSCGEYRVAAERRDSVRLVVIERLEAALRDRPPPRAWRLGVTGGYGGTLVASDGGRRLVTGPSLTVGVTWSP